MTHSRFRSVFGFTVIGFTAVACGSAGSNHKAPSVREAPRVKGSPASLNLFSMSSDKRITGTWMSNCVENSDGSSSKLKVEITDQYFQQTNSLFNGLGCFDPILDARIIGSYTAEEGVLTVTLKQTHIRVSDSRFTEAAEAGASCGFNRWQPDVWYNLTDKVCTKSKNGIWVSPTKSGTMSAMPFTIAATSSDTTLIFAGTTLSRPTREGDVPPPPAPPLVITPIRGDSNFLFAEPNAHGLENFLRNWGCIESLELGLSDCPAPKTLDEASLLVDKLISFCHAVYADAHFKNDPIAQARLSRGCDAEFNKVIQFPAYGAVLDALRQELVRLNKEHPQYIFAELYNVNALRATKSLKTLRAAFDTFDLEAELQRLRVTKIYAAGSDGYGKNAKEIWLMWGDTSTPKQMFEFLQSQTPKEIDPAPASSVMGMRSIMVGF